MANVRMCNMNAAGALDVGHWARRAIEATSSLTGAAATSTLADIATPPLKPTSTARDPPPKCAGGSFGEKSRRGGKEEHPVQLRAGRLEMFQMKLASIE